MGSFFTFRLVPVILGSYYSLRPFFLGVFFFLSLFLPLSRVFLALWPLPHVPSVLSANFWGFFIFSFPLFIAFYAFFHLST